MCVCVYANVHQGLFMHIYMHMPKIAAKVYFRCWVHTAADGYLLAACLNVCKTA